VAERRQREVRTRHIAGSTRRYEGREGCEGRPRRERRDPTGQGAGRPRQDAGRGDLDAPKCAKIATTFSKEPPGTVVDQEPKPGVGVPKNTAVTITVSSGTEKVNVPKVTGKTSKDAQAALKAAGFSVSVKEQNSNDIAEGIVIDQSPGADVSAEKGSGVTITVSIGPATFGMPLVKGMTEAAAKALLQGKGLVVSVTTETATTDTVLDQNPSEGVQVKKGDNVSIKVGSVETSPTP
jgi:beta-lactam-binding protein with PASTA domain